MNKIIKIVLSITTMLALTLQAEEKKEIQDMSDPLAVYTQAGLGLTDKGINIKVGGAYDSGKPATMAMNVIEIQGILGDTLGIRDDLTNQIDSIRFRNFVINTKNGQGSQVDISYNQNTKTGAASYSIIQALPKWGILQIYPLAGLGLSIANNLDDNALWSDANSPSGISVPGVFGTIGMYSRIAVTKKIWINYNPIWMSAIAGAPNYVKNSYGLNTRSLFTHEVALSYQISPVFNVRYFGNWSDKTSFVDGGQRIEFNYQL